MDYAGLQAQIAAFAHRDDLVGVIPSFIQMYEARANRTLRTPYQEARATTTANSEYIGVPADFVKERGVVDATTGEFLEYLAPGDFQRVKARGQDLSTLPSGNTHRLWTFVDMQFRFLPAPTVSATFACELLYYARIPALSATNTSNWLLASHPDAYVYGTLLVAHSYVGARPELVAQWKALYEQCEQELNAQGTVERMYQYMAVRPENKPYQQSPVTF